MIQIGLSSICTITGISEEERTNRYQKNLVSTQMNFIGWLLQASLEMIFIDTIDTQTKQDDHTQTKPSQIQAKSQNLENSKFQSLLWGPYL